MFGFVGALTMDNDREHTCEDSYNPLQTLVHPGTRATHIYGDGYIHISFPQDGIKNMKDSKKERIYQDERFLIALNGVIYNASELRKRLISEGFAFETHSDAEIILALYTLNREKCIELLRGMFTFSIWDSREKTLFAARDPFGIKPFYYMESDNAFIFGSEKKLLADNDSHTEVLQESFQHYLTYQYVPDPYSLTGNIQKLKPGSYLLKKSGEDMEIQIYYRKEFKPSYKNLHYYVEKTRQVLDDSVAQHLKSDVPVGAFLSSGIDSTAIVALAKQYRPDIKAFTVGFERGGYNETDIAKESADQLDVENIHKLITPEEFVNELPNIIWNMDNLVADPAAVPLYFAAKEASKHVNVVLSGEGADELFGGYNIYREPLALKGFSYLPAFLKKLMKRLALLLPEGIKGRNFLLRGTTPLSERYIGNANIFSETEKQQLLQHYQFDAPFTAITESLYREAMAYDDTTKMQYIDLHTWLPGDILAKVDSMNAAHALELRTPFLDKKVFEVAREIPTNAKIAKKTTKYVLREALKDIIPNDVLYRKKLGFPVPIRHWLRNELYDWAQYVIKNSPTEHLIKKYVILSLLEEHALHKKDNSRKIWVIIVFMQWYVQHVIGEQDAGRLRLFS